MKYEDPYDNMTDDEFERHFLSLFPQPQSTTVSIRMPRPLLERIKEEADRVNQPYQSFMKTVLEDAVNRLARTQVGRARTRASKRKAEAGVIPSRRIGG